MIRSDPAPTTIVARVCRNMLRSRNRRREEVLGVRLPDPVIRPARELQPADTDLALQRQVVDA